LDLREHTVPERREQLDHVVCSRGKDALCSLYETSKDQRMKIVEEGAVILGCSFSRILFLVLQLQEKGNEAFQKKDYGDAITFYTNALAYEQKPTFYSNRSAAYLKNGQHEEALKDAEACIKLDPKFVKGYSRKGTALVAMKQFDDAILAYKAGLKECPDDESLTKGLAATQRAKLGFKETTKAASQAAVRGRASFRASISRKAKADKAAGVSEFVAESRKFLKLRMVQLQAQLDLLDALAEMSEDEKLEMLFTLLDTDGDGFIDARELAEGIRKRRDDLSFSGSLDRAMDMVAIFDDDGDARLSQDEFKNCIDTLTTELGSTFHEFAEFLILQMIFMEGNAPVEQLAAVLVKPEIDAEVKGRKQLLDILTDPRLVQLFTLFDKTGDGVLNFKEVAIGLYQLTSDMEGSIKATVELLLTMDENDDRTIDYEQFARLILSFCAAAETSFDDMADDLTLALSQDTVTMTEEELAVLYISDEYYSAAKDLEGALKEEVKVQSLLGYGRLLKLFDLLDEDKDGGISTEELAIGLKKFHAAMGIESDEQLEAALLMFGSDTKGDSKLGKEDFARAMVTYASANDVDVHELVDFMSVSALMDTEKREGYNKAIRQSVAGDMIQFDIIAIEVDEEDY